MQEIDELENLIESTLSQQFPNYRYSFDDSILLNAA
jgi:hypothetical protein